MNATRLVICGLLAFPASWFAGLLIDRVPPMGRDADNNLRDPAAKRLFADPPGLRVHGVYLTVLILMVAMYLATAYRFMDLAPVLTLPYLVWWCGLVALAVVDALERRLPDRIVLPLFVIGTAVMVGAGVLSGSSVSIRFALVGSGAYFALFFVLNLIHPALAAFGDVKTSAVVGMTVGFVTLQVSDALVLSVYGILTAMIVAAVVGFASIVSGGIARARERRVGLGSYLVFGAFVVVMFSTYLVGG